MIFTMKINCFQKLVIIGFLLWIGFHCRIIPTYKEVPNPAYDPSYVKPAKPEHNGFDGAMEWLRGDPREHKTQTVETGFYTVQIGPRYPADEYTTQNYFDAALISTALFIAAGFLPTKLPTRKPKP